MRLRSSLFTSVVLLASLAVGTGVAGAAPGGSDLVVNVLSNSNGAAKQGATVFLVSAVRNSGRSAARASQARFYLSRDRRIDRGDVVIGSRRVPRLQAGKRSRATVRVKIPATIAAGLYYLAACADVGKRVAERREGNNCRFATKRLRVIAGGSLGPPDGSALGAVAGPVSGPIVGPTLGSPPGPPANPDRDGDGTANELDCAPDDPSIPSAAVDRPDVPAFRDTNCDGIDGDKARAVFVAPVGFGGSDANSGAFGQPKATLPSAITAAAAATPAKDVYIASGGYLTLPAPVVLANGVGIYGGYDPVAWVRSLAGGSVTTAIGTGASAQNVTVVLQLVAFNGVASGTPQQSTYGLRALNATLTLERVTLNSGGGGTGINGAISSPVQAPGGQNGVLGVRGRENSSAPTCLSGGNSAGGPGGNQSPISVRSGGTGGAARTGGVFGLSGEFGYANDAAGGAGTPPGLGDWNPSNLYWGSDGPSGAPGPHGLAGGTPAFGASGVTPSSGSSGSSGGHGHGGGGGGGGGGGTNGCDSSGGGGGGGGGGGAGGVGGSGGSSGGGSVALYLWGSTVTTLDSGFVTGSGGNGGVGRQGQFGGVGGLGGRRSGTDPAGNPWNAGNLYGTGIDDQDDGSNGGKGGNGGTGGNGGSGGGAAGGPSIGVLIGGGSTFGSTSSTFATGPGGAGGSSPGNAGPAGASANTLTTP